MLVLTAVVGDTIRVGLDAKVKLVKIDREFITLEATLGLNFITVEMSFNQSFFLSPNVQVQFSGIRDRQVRLGFKAPRSIGILRDTAINKEPSCSLSPTVSTPASLPVV